MRRRFDNGTKKEILCKRVVRAYDLAQRVARKEVQEPRFLLALLPTFPVGALRKYAGGIFLASDLGGYAAVASILSLKVPSYAVRAVGDAGPYAATAGNRP